MNITIRQLQAFREVLRTGSISDAARSLHRSQPAVSCLISNLEKELGIELFERQPGKLIRKPEAQYFLEETETILERLAQFTRTMKEVGDLQEGRLRITCMSSSALLMMPKLVAKFVSDKPKVKVSMMVRASTIIEEWVASQQYDIGLSETPTANPSLKVQTFELLCVCALQRDDPLSEKKVIKPKDLNGKPLATLNEEHPNFVATRKVFRDAAAQFNPRFELRNYQPGLRLVEENLCYCICDPMTASSYAHDHGEHSAVVFRPFLPHIPLSVSILQPANRPISLLASSFAELLEDKLLLVNQQFHPNSHN